MPQTKDHIIVKPRVVAAIAALTTLSVPGVARFRGQRYTHLARFLGRGWSQGVRLHIVGNTVAIDLDVVMSAGFNLLQASRQVQTAVYQAVTEMTDMQVRQVNVHIAGVRASTYA